MSVALLCVFVFFIHSVFSFVILNDPAHHTRSLSSDPIVQFDILDDIRIEFDLNISAFQFDSGDIIDLVTLGDDISFMSIQYNKTQSFLIFRVTTIGDHFDSFTSVINSITLNTKHHIIIRQTHSLLQLQLDNSSIYNASYSSHAISFNVTLYVGSLTTPVTLHNISISMLYVYSGHLSFNYLCDATKRFSMNNDDDSRDGVWYFNNTACTVSQTDSEATLAVVEMFGFDNSSLKWKNYRVETDIMLHDTGGNAQLSFMLQPSIHNSYSVQLNQVYEILEFMKYKVGESNGYVFPVPAQTVMDISSDIWYAVAVEINDTQFSVYINNTLKFTLHDSEYRSGSVGFRTWNMTATYSSLRITFHSDNYVHSVDPTQSPSNVPTLPYIPVTSSIPSLYPSVHPFLSTLSSTDEPSTAPTRSFVGESTIVASETSVSIIRNGTMINNEYDGKVKVNTIAINVIFEDTNNDDKESVALLQILISVLIGLLALALIGYIAVWFNKRRMNRTIVDAIVHINPAAKRKQTIVEIADFEASKARNTNELNSDYVTPVGLKKKCNKDALDIQFWLENIVELPQYFEYFMDSGYESMDFIKEIPNITELREIGIASTKHQKKIFDEIKKLKGEQINDNLSDFVESNMTVEGQSRSSQALETPGTMTQ